MSTTAAPDLPRIPLAALPGRGSPVLARVLLPQRQDGPEPVKVAAFQSAV